MHRNIAIIIVILGEAFGHLYDQYCSRPKSSWFPRVAYWVGTKKDIKSTIKHVGEMVGVTSTLSSRLKFEHRKYSCVMW